MLTPSNSYTIMSMLNYCDYTARYSESDYLLSGEELSYGRDGFGVARS
jgi:hypothetical protein